MKVHLKEKKCLMNAFNEIIAELDMIKKIINDPKLYESEREKYFKEKNE